VAAVPGRSIDDRHPRDLVGLGPDRPWRASSMERAGPVASPPEAVHRLAAALRHGHRRHYRGDLAARVAVVRFSGRWTDRNMKEHEEALRRWASARKLTVAGEPEVNRYDPPWTPWFLRRNEVWLAIADDAGPTTP